MNVKAPGHIINQLVAFPHMPFTSVAAGTLPFGTVFSAGRFSRVFLPTGASLPRHGNGDGLRLAHACVVVGRGVCEGHVSILTWQVIEVAAWSERAWLPVIV
ncbi:hypothetical protein O9993_05585 [Vibrio lentus]|nr:hypothetical protein [Vibrio lentus]